MLVKWFSLGSGLTAYGRQAFYPPLGKTGAFKPVSCNRMFTSLSAFDLHRTGKFERKKRRCLTEQEMLAKGMVQNAKGWWMRVAFDGEIPWFESEDEQEEAS